MDIREVVGNTVLRPSLDEINFHHLKWIDVHNPSDKVLEDLAKTVHLAKKDLVNALDRDEMPRVSEVSHFTLVVMKSPLHNRKSHISSTSVAFFISERLLISLHQDPIESIQELLDLSDADLGSLMHKGGTGECFYHLIERITHEFYLTLDDVELQIDRLENAVFAHPSQTVAKKIFSVKQTLIYLHKALAANRDVITHLEKEPSIHVKDEVRDRFKYLYYDTIQLLDVAATYRDILTGTLDIYLSSVSNNMNAIMKKMTAYSTLVLVPTFITGLYGMNFRMMPEVSWKYGYLFAWFLIIGSLVILTHYFKKNNWF